MLKRLITPLFVGALALAGPASAQYITSETEPNNTDSAASGPVGSGVTVAGTLTNNDVDWFYFDVASGGGTISVSLAHQTGGNRDFDWYLYEETGPWIARGATSANPENGSHSVSSGGRYYIRVIPHRGTGWYNLTVNFPQGSSGGGGGNGGGGGGGTPENFGPRPSKPGSLQVWITGNSADAQVNPTGPAVVLQGGNFDINETFTNRVAPLIGGGDVVVLRASGSNGYNSYFNNLLNPDSVETMIVNTRSKANSDYVEWVLKSAEFIWIAGGDQAAYLNYWQGTKVEDAIRYAYNRGAVVGGISAGNAVMGQFIYDPDGVPGVFSSEALANPYNYMMNISDNFLNLPLTNQVITDTHFRQRDRMGRLAAFMARIRTDGRSPVITGIGVDEDTSLFIDKNGVGTVDGDFSVYVLRENSNTNIHQCVAGQPLVYMRIQRTKLNVGQTFNFNTGATNGTTVSMDVEGDYPNDPYRPANPYN